MQEARLKMPLLKLNDLDLQPLYFSKFTIGCS